MEQHINIKFCLKLVKTVTDTHEMLVQVYCVKTASKILHLNGLNTSESERKMSRMDRVRIDHPQT
ncbi:hypothetical protein C0J52_10846 [Blattella germanica]|nr:hypothetical protein C0J52_10846 [Blattella germanica]